MTVAVAWVRKLRDCEELIFVSDSRLSGDGRTFDSSPKILTLPRTDCAIAFAGYTGHAFPMMLQLSLAIDSYAPARRGSLDISTVKQHALKVFDSMSDSIQSSTLLSKLQDSTPDAMFLFGGFSWINKKFRLWTMSYQGKEQHFRAYPASVCYYSLPGKRFWIKQTSTPHEPAPQIAFAGDQGETVRDLLQERLLRKYPGGMGYEGLDWEPFEIIRDMLRKNDHPETIGGAPQVVKVYQYMRSAPLGVYWPSKLEGKAFIQGRLCLGYENIDRWILDPDTLISQSPTYSRRDVDDDTRGAPELVGEEMDGLMPLPNNDESEQQPKTNEN